jgi:TRAP-type mannitol/chloroaromatic compound transport system permease small subunit
MSLAMLLRISAWIDRITATIGNSIRWLMFGAILIAAYNALARYIGRSVGFNLSSNFLIEIQWVLFSFVFLFGAANGLRRRVHVQVDLFSSRLSESLRTRIDLWGGILLLIPFSIVIIVLTLPSVVNSWMVLEGSPDPGGIPRYPIKTAVPMAFLLLFAQGVSEIIKAVHTLKRIEGGAGVS